MLSSFLSTPRDLDPRGRSSARGYARVAARLAVGVVAAVLLMSANAWAAAPTLLSSFGCSVATPCGSFTSWTPTFVASDITTGDVYVTDSLNGVVEVFSATGTYERQLVPPGATHPGTATSFSFGATNPDDVALDNSGGPHDGNVYIESNGGGLVFAYDKTGNFLWQSNAGVAYAGGVGVDPSGNPWLGDIINGIQELSPVDGSAVGKPLLASDNPANLAFDSAGNIVTVEYSAGVHVFDPSGNPLHADDTGLINSAVDVDRTNNRVFSVDSNGVTIWDASGKMIQGMPFAPGTNSVAVNWSNGEAYLAQPSSGKVAIYTLPTQHTVTVTPAGAGGGHVDADYGTISNCSSAGGTCSDKYDQGDTVNLTATAATGDTFTGWSGGGCSGTAPCKITVSADTTVTATFSPPPSFNLTVTPAGTGGGTVTSNPAGIDCGATCSHPYVQGTIVSLSVAARPGSTFTGWSGGGCAGTGSCVVNMTADTTVTAAYTQQKPGVTTGVASAVTDSAATVSGTVNPEGGAVSDCHVDYGTTTSYGSQLACAGTIGTGTGPVSVSAALSGLAPSTTYHYRVVATNGGGTTDGADATFTTVAPSGGGGGGGTGGGGGGGVGGGGAGGGTQNPVLTLSASALRQSRGVVTLRLSCARAMCIGTVTIKVKVMTGKGRHRHSKTITAGSTRVQLNAGSSKLVRVRLSRAALSALAAHRSLSVTLAGPGFTRVGTLRR